MRRKKNREINVFSASALDLFVSAMGVFLLMLVVAIPYYGKTSSSHKVPMIEKDKYDRILKQLQDLQAQMILKDKRIKELELEVERLKKEIEELKKRLALLPPPSPSVKPPVAAPIDRTAELLKKIEELNQMIKERDHRIVELLKEIESLKAQLEETKKTEILLKDLQQEVVELKTLKEKHFLVAVVKWATERHDIDLELKSPEGLTYNFKNKKFAKGTGQFALDSRTGPGAELWQSANAMPGEYVLRYNFYNNYGNKEPAAVAVTLLSQTGTYDLPIFSMDFDKIRSNEVRFLLGNDGKIIIK